DLFREKHIEAGERAVTAADVALQLDLHVFGQIGRVHLLLERPQAVAQHHDFMEEGLDRPGLLLQSGGSGAERQACAPPFLGWSDRADAGLLANDAAEEQLEIHTGAVDGHGRRTPLALADNGKRIASRPGRSAAWPRRGGSGGGLSSLLAYPG